MGNNRGLNVGIEGIADLQITEQSGPVCHLSPGNRFMERKRREYSDFILKM